MLFPGEKSAIRIVLNEGERYGYGNMIAHLRTEWAKKLVAQGIPEEVALVCADSSPYPLSWDWESEDVLPAVTDDLPASAGRGQ